MSRADRARSPSVSARQFAHLLRPFAKLAFGELGAICIADRAEVV
jgi:hypothetical protein